MLSYATAKNFICLNMKCYNCHNNNNLEKIETETIHINTK